MSNEIRNVTPSARRWLLITGKETIMQTANILNLPTVEQAIIGRLKHLAERDRQLELERLLKEQRDAEAKARFAQALSDRLCREYGIRISTDVIYPNLQKDNYNETFRFSATMDAPSGDGIKVLATLAMRWHDPIEHVEKDGSLDWIATRVAYDDEGNCQFPEELTTDDFVAALTFAKTGKR